MAEYYDATEAFAAFAATGVPLNPTTINPDICPDALVEGEPFKVAGVVMAFSGEGGQPVFVTGVPILIQITREIDGTLYWGGTCNSTYSPAQVCAGGKTVPSNESGVFNVRMWWEGNSTYDGCETNFSIEIVAAATIIPTQITADVMYPQVQVGLSQTVSGVLSTTLGSPIADETVEVWAKVPGASTYGTFLGYALTDMSGMYAYNFDVGVEGSWDLMVLYRGTVPESGAYALNEAVDYAHMGAW